MAISSEKYKKIYSGDDVSTVFAYDFKIFAEAEIEVIKYEIATETETVLTLNTDYTVSGVGEDAGGDITLASILLDEYQLILRRKVPLTQETDYEPNGPMPTAVLEEALDRGVMLIQQMQEQLDRCVILDASQESQITFPLPEADKVIGWNAAGNKLVNKTDPVSSVIRGTFVNADLATGVLTIAHSQALSAPYSVSVRIFDNTGKEILPDSVTGATNSVAVDLTSFGTLTGTWGYILIA